MILLAVGFVATLLFFATAHVLDLSVAEGWPGGERSPPLRYVWVLLLYPALGAWFWFRNRDTSNGEPDAAPKGDPTAPGGSAEGAEGPPSVS